MSDGVLRFRLRSGQQMQHGVRFSEWLVRFGRRWATSSGRPEVRPGLLRLASAQGKMSERNERLRIFGRAIGFPGDSVLKGLDGLVPLAEGLVRQAHVVFRFDVPWLEL